MYVSELIEEHSRLAKQIGQRGIYVCHIHISFVNALFDSDTIRSWYLSTLYYTSQTRSHFSRLPSLSSVTLSTSRISRIPGHSYHSHRQPSLLPAYWLLRITSHGSFTSRISHPRRDIPGVIWAVGRQHQDSLKLRPSSVFVCGWHLCFFFSV